MLINLYRLDGILVVSSENEKGREISNQLNTGSHKAIEPFTISPELNNLSLSKKKKKKRRTIIQLTRLTENVKLAPFIYFLTDKNKNERHMDFRLIVHDFWNHDFV